MSAELLRRAAKEMRERASAATPGPWSAHRTDDPSATAQVSQAPKDDHLVCDVERCAEHPGKAGPDAEHIASWHPAVALAVADLLDMCARVFPEKPEAVALARTYLGEQSS